MLENSHAGLPDCFLLDCPTVFRRYLQNPWSLDQFDCTVVIGRLGRTFMYGGSMDLRRLEKKLDF
jgi:hypothetical protein